MTLGWSSTSFWQLVFGDCGLGRGPVLYSRGGAKALTHHLARVCPLLLQLSSQHCGACVAAMGKVGSRCRMGNFGFPTTYGLFAPLTAKYRPVHLRRILQFGHEVPMNGDYGESNISRPSTKATVPERSRGSTRNRLGNACVGSNPAGRDNFWNFSLNGGGESHAAVHFLWRRRRGLPRQRPSPCTVEARGGGGEATRCHSRIGYRV
jgi:hypothetical protein